LHDSWGTKLGNLRLNYSTCFHQCDQKLIPRNSGYRVSKPHVDLIKKSLQPPKEKERRTEKVYESGQSYDLYRDIKSIILSAKQEVFVIDAYASEDIIDLYLDKLPTGVKMMVLTNTPKDNFINVAQKFKKKHGANFIVKTNSKCHDRLFFVDKRCYVIGQSVDNATSEKPTYLSEIQNSGIFRNVFQTLFDLGKTLF